MSFRTAITAAWTTLVATEGVAVIYARGAITGAYTAVEGAGVHKVDRGTYSPSRVLSTDWRIGVADMASLGVPQRGDTVTCDGSVYEVMPFGDSPCYEMARGGVWYRIRSKQIG